SQPRSRRSHGAGRRLRRQERVHGHLPEGDALQRMVKERRRWIVPGLAVAAVAGVGWVVLRDTSPAAPSASAAETPKGGGRREPELPRIDLARLDRPRASSGIGRRDLFDFATPPPTPPPPAPPSAAPGEVETPPPVTVPTPPPLAPI